MTLKWAEQEKWSWMCTSSFLPPVLRVACLLTRPRIWLQKKWWWKCSALYRWRQQAIGVTRSGVCLPSLPPLHCRVCTDWSGDHYTIDVWRTAGPYPHIRTLVYKQNVHTCQLWTLPVKSRWPEEHFLFTHCLNGHSLFMFWLCLAIHLRCPAVHIPHTAI